MHIEEMREQEVIVGARGSRSRIQDSSLCSLSVFEIFHHKNTQTDSTAKPRLWPDTLGERKKPSHGEDSAPMQSLGRPCLGISPSRGTRTTRTEPAFRGHRLDDEGIFKRGEPLSQAVQTALSVSSGRKTTKGRRQGQEKEPTTGNSSI
jgi:hypothetical protein